MAAPKGNTNASTARAVKDQMKWVLENYTDSKVEQGQALREICKVAVKDALAGDKEARQAVFDRTEGKAVATTHLETGSEGFIINIVK